MLADVIAKANIRTAGPVIQKEAPSLCSSAERIWLRIPNVKVPLFLFSPFSSSNPSSHYLLYIVSETATIRSNRTRARQRR